MPIGLARTCRTSAAAALFSFVGVAGCTTGDHASIAASAVTAQQSKVPALSVHPSVAEADAADLLALITASAQVIQSADFRENAARVAIRYPGIYINGDLGYRGPEAVVAMLQSPPDALAYNETPVKFGSGAITGHDGREWRMVIRNNTLKQWRSGDPVERSCAVNTVAHEAAHTLVDRSRNGAMIFIDGGFGAGASRREGTTASYVVGQLAQCTWLQQQGRISASDVLACVPVFYSKPSLPWQRGKFAVARCDDFSDGGPVA